MGTFKVIRGENGNECRTIDLCAEKSWVYGELSYGFAKEAEFICVKYMKGGVECKYVAPTSINGKLTHKNNAFLEDVNALVFSEGFEGFIKDDVELIFKGGMNGDDEI